MKNWKESVQARQGYTDQQKQRNLLSDLTQEGISITGTELLLKVITIAYILFSVIIC